MACKLDIHVDDSASNKAIHELIKTKLHRCYFQEGQYRQHRFLCFIMCGYCQFRYDRTLAPRTQRINLPRLQNLRRRRGSDSATARGRATASIVDQ